MVLVKSETECFSMWASLFRETATTAEQSKRETVSVQNLFLAMIRR